MEKSIIIFNFAKHLLGLGMNETLRRYENQKVTEAILYVLNKTGVISYFKVMKILFCADRANLKRWGDPVTCLNYYARKHGPVPVSVYQAIKYPKPERVFDFAETIERVGEYDVKPLRQSDENYLSQTDKDSLNYAISELQGKDYKEIETYLHEQVYERLYASKNKRYSHVDIASTEEVSESVLAQIRENDIIAKMLS